MRRWPFYAAAIVLVTIALFGPLRLFFIGSTLSNMSSMPVGVSKHGSEHTEPGESSSQTTNERAPGVSRARVATAVPKTVITVFSTACIPFHDWQSEALIYSHHKHQIQGRLIRIDSCSKKNYAYPKIWHPNYSIFVTPSLEHQNTSFGPDKYSGYNRPGGLVYWLDNDPSAAKADSVIVLDPDMIIRSPLDRDMMGEPRNTDFAGPGRVGGGVYDFGDGWYRHTAKKELEKMGCPHRSCNLSSEELSRLLIGPPLLFTYSDLKLLASPWMEFTKIFRAGDKNKGWAQEMYGLTMALAYHGNRPNVSSFLFISAPQCSMEGWDCVGMTAPKENFAKFKFHPQEGSKVSPVLHYCQSYQLPKAKFYKYQYNGKEAEALMACGSKGAYMKMGDIEKELQADPTVRENAMKRRAAYMIREVTQDTNAALKHYRDVACTPQKTN